MATRGGRAGGRAGGGKGGVRNLGIEIDPELDSLADSAPSETYPPLQPPIAELPSADEKYMVEHYRFLRKRLHNGDFYTILGDGARIKRTPAGRRIREPRTAHFDPFEDQPTYAKRFKREHKTLPDLKKRHFEMQYFPRELWATIDPKTKSDSAAQVSKRKTSQRVDADVFEDREEERTSDKEDDDRPDDEKDQDDDDKEDNEDGKENADEDNLDEDQFSDGDDNDDYNAEMYFNDGGDDDDGDRGGDDYGGGGDDTY